MASPGPITNLVGRIAYEFAQAQPYIPMYLHLIVSALFPIYAGAHASLSRPSSAAAPEKKRRHEEEDGEESEEEIEVVQRMEGLLPSDALIFPVLAGSTLAGLYFLIKWLNNPALLNKILNWYFSAFGVFSISKLVADALKVSHSVLFPKRYVYGGRIWHVNNRDESVSTRGGDGSISPKSPLPGLLARMPLPSSFHNLLWRLSTLPSRKLMIKASLYGFGALKLKMGIHDFVGLFSGLSAVLYYNVVSKPWWLTNLLGFGFCYGAIQLMSPTTFWTGTLIQSALFFYDIYFVFFTPMMVTVAKSLDIPIKLLFPRPPAPDADPAVQQLAMLGLGDIVLPGIMIGLALRFDLYLLYLRKQRKVARVEGRDVGDKPSVMFDSAAGCFRVQSGKDMTSVKSSEQDGQAIESQHAKDFERPDNGEQQETEIVRAPYESVAGGWGKRFWTSSWTGRSRIPHSEPSTFAKTYFHASLAGYVAGMLATLGVMQVTSHPQPALLYLVPGVLGSLWTTALVRGEVKHMWEYSERSEDEVEKMGSDGGRRAGEKGEKYRQASKDGSAASSDTREDETRLGGGESLKNDIFPRDGGREVLFFSISAPAPRKPRKVGTDGNSGQGPRPASDGSTVSELGPSSNIESVGGTTFRRRSSQMSESEPAIKRQRTE